MSGFWLFKRSPSIVLQSKIYGKPHWKSSISNKFRMPHKHASNIDSDLTWAGDY